MRTILDSNVVLDILIEDPVWFGWSERHMRDRRRQDALLINPIIFAESSLRHATFGEYKNIVSAIGIGMEEIPWEAAYLAGQAQNKYRRSGGKRDRVLADFLIGAHAATRGYCILTRDQARYRSYFPSIDIIAPDTHP